MEDLKVQVCRLCFSLISDKNFLQIVGSLKDMLQVITTDLHVNVTSSPVMCSECSKAVQDLFSFKTNFFESEEKIELKLGDKDVKLDLADVMNSSSNSRAKRKCVKVKLKHPKICRTCLRKIKGESFIFLNKSADIFLSLMIESCLSELDLNLTSDPVMCQTCYEILQKMYVFKTMCKENESRIEAYSKTLGTSCQKKLNLHSIIQFLSNTGNKLNIPEHVTVLAVKTEPVNGNNDLVRNKVKFEPGGEYRDQNCLKYVTVKMELEDEELKTEEEKKMNEKCGTRNSYLKFKIKKEPTNEDSGTRQEINKQGKDTELENNLMYKTRYKTKNKGTNVETDDESMSQKSRRISYSKGLRQNRVGNKHKAKKIVHCNDCKFKTKYNYSLRRHLCAFHEHHLQVENPQQNVEVKRKFYYKCPHCDFSARYNIDLTRHMLFHVKPEAFQCKRCPYSTNQNSHLVKHILSHINDDNKNRPSFLQRENYF